MVSSRRLSEFLQRLARALRDGRIEFTLKAQDELWRMNWSSALALEVLAGLLAADFHRTEASRVKPGAIIWVFTPEDLHEGPLWIRLEEIGDIVFIVISFHPQEEP